MENRLFIFLFFIVFSFSFCNNNHSDNKNADSDSIFMNKDSLSDLKKSDSLEKTEKQIEPVHYKDSDMVDITEFSEHIVLDIHYARKDNFLNMVLYPCAKCLLRYEVLQDLLLAEAEFESMGLFLKVYDCYRPLRVQKLMWKKIPKPGLVANPATGSRHNRGSAVDVSLVDSKGKELDFGSCFDDFSAKGKTFYPNLPDTVKKNRMLLRSIMQKHNFKGINSEWWHFTHNCGTKYPVSDAEFNCDTLPIP